MAFDPLEHGWLPVGPKDTFPFHCAGCGDCCRNIANCVMVESLDVYRIARHLEMEPGEVALQYTDITTLALDFPVLMLKTKQHMDACVFLRSGKCRIHEANPRICRTYPLGVCPDDDKPGELMSFIVSHKDHHFHGPPQIVGDWMARTMPAEDQAFILEDAAAMLELAGPFAKISPVYQEEAQKLIVYFKYMEYDTAREFMPQYHRNMDHLKGLLARLVEQSRRA